MTTTPRSEPTQMSDLTKELGAVLSFIPTAEGLRSASASWIQSDGTRITITLSTGDPHDEWDDE